MTTVLYVTAVDLLLNVMLFQGTSVCKVPRSTPSMSDLSYHGHRRGMHDSLFLARHAIPQDIFVIKQRGHTGVHEKIILILCLAVQQQNHIGFESQDSSFRFSLNANKCSHLLFL